jgi:hypothetical protein
MEEARTGRDFNARHFPKLLKERKMKATVGIRKDLFDELIINKREKKLLELSKLPDDDLYRRMGAAGRKKVSSVRPSNVYLESPNRGDTEGKSPTFFRNEKIALMSPALFFDPTLNDLEGGKMLFGELEWHLDRLVCETAAKSPLYGYKQEAIRLANLCVEAIEKTYPEVDRGIVEIFVALRMKGMFTVCTRY